MVDVVNNACIAMVVAQVPLIILSAHVRNVVATTSHALVFYDSPECVCNIIGDREYHGVSDGAIDFSVTVLQSIVFEAFEGCDKDRWPMDHFC